MMNNSTDTITINVPRIVFQNHRLVDQLHATLKRNFPDHTIIFSTKTPTTRCTSPVRP